LIVGTANVLTVDTSLSTAILSVNAVSDINLTINSSLTLGPGVSLDVSTINNSNLTNVRSLTFASGFVASHPSIVWDPAVDTYMNTYVLANSNLVESNVQKFVTYASYAPSYAHLAGALFPPTTGRIAGLSGINEKLTQLATFNWGVGGNAGTVPFQAGQVLASNVLLHKNFTEGYIVPPMIKTVVYEPDLSKHEYSNGYFMTANATAWNHTMVLKKADSSNLHSNIRYPSWSVSKAVGSMVMMALLDKGYLKSLDDKISNYYSNVPTVGNNRLKVYEKDATLSRIAAQDITVRHVLTEAHSLIAKSPLGDGCSVPIRMTSDKKTYDLSDFEIASNVGIAANDYSANLFVLKDIFFAGGAFTFEEPRAFIGPDPSFMWSRAADYVQSWFDDQASNPMYLTAEPGEAGVYSSTTQITTGLIEKIYQKSTGQANTYHQILTELILQPIGLGADDFCQWQTPAQAANTWNDSIGAAQIGSLAGDAFTDGLNGYSKEFADIITRPPLAGPFRDLPYAAGVAGNHMAYLKDGTRNPTVLNVVRSFLFLSNVGAPANFARTVAAQTDYYTDQVNYSNAVSNAIAATYASEVLYPDLSASSLFPANVASLGDFKFYDINLGWNATADTYGKIFSIISNKGYYIKAGQAPVRVLSPGVISAFFDREDGLNEPVWPTIGQTVGTVVGDAEGFFINSTERQSKSVVTAYTRRVPAYDKTGAEIPAALLLEYINRSNVAGSGLANIFSATSYNQLDTLYRTGGAYSNISESIVPIGPGFIAKDVLPKHNVVFTAGAGGIQIIMDQNTGYTWLKVGAAGSEFLPTVYDTSDAPINALLAEKVSDLGAPVFRDNRILDSPLLYSNWVNRNTLVAKPAERFIRTNRLEIYPEGGLAANVVSLTADYLSNLVVSNVSSTTFTVGPA
jgi:hypothetical protein